jgi:vitamin B12/bleomycin/antimicrobial peptide transport system ATP-binding/permease protein
MPSQGLWNRFRISARADDPVAREERARLTNLLRRFWSTALLFWSGKPGSRAWLLSLALLLTIILVVGAAYAMNAWNRAMFDNLQSRDVSAVASLSLIYFVILAGSVMLGVIQVYLRMTLQRRWRGWMSERLVDAWMTNGRYYQLNLLHGGHGNPEHRIAEDVRIATESPLDFASGITQAFLSAATFIVVLWTIGGTLSVGLGSFTLQIPGFLVIAALLYAIVASGAMVLIGSRFVQASESKNTKIRALGTGKLTSSARSTVPRAPSRTCRRR